MITYTTPTGNHISISHDAILLVNGKRINACRLSAVSIAHGQIDLGFAKVAIPDHLIKDVVALLRASDDAVLAAANKYAAEDFSSRMDRRMYGANASDGVGHVDHQDDVA